MPSGPPLRFHPLVPAAAAYLAGVAAASWLEPPAWPLLAAAAAAAGAAAWAAAASGRLSPAAAALVALLAGAGLYAADPPQTPPPGHVAHLVKGRAVTLVAETVSAPQPTGHGWRFLVEARRVEGRPAFGLVRVNTDRRPPPPVGAEVAALVRLKPVASFANPGGFDYAAHMAEQGVFVTAYAGKRAGLRVLGPGRAGGPGLWLERARARLSLLLHRLPPGGGRALVRALVLGQRAELASADREAFAVAGAAHLLAISGLHLGLVWGLGFLVLRVGLAAWPGLALRVSAVKWAAAGALAPCAAYALLAGAGLPVLRALIMASVLVLALLSGRPYRPAGALALAALAIGILWPRAPLTLSFQLSFAAVAAILLAAGPAAARVRAGVRSRWLGAGLAWLVLSLVVGLAVWPIAVQHFHRLPWLSPLGNALLVPLVGVLALPPALAGAGAGLAWPAAGLTLWEAARWPAAAALATARALAGLPGAELMLAGPGPGAAALMFAAALAGLLLPGRWRWAGAGGLAAAALAAWLVPGPPPPDGRLTAWVLDVGQGSSAAVRLPGGRVMVVDGGGWSSPDFDFGRRVVAPFLWSQGVERLEVVAASHAHPDHAGGLPFLARWFGPQMVWTNGEPASGGPYARLLARARAAGAEIQGPEAIARRVELDGARLMLVWPRPRRPLPERENDRSLWLGVGLGESWLWLPGDVGPEVERRVAPRLPPGRHALVAPHHGGKGSCSRELLARLRPEVVVFSCGCGNRFGFPRPDALSRARAGGAAVYSTARQGCLTLVTAGEGWRVSPRLQPPRSCPR